MIRHSPFLPIRAIVGVTFELILKGLANADKDGILTQPTMFRANARKE
jgi:hypothetical protein